MCSGDRSWYLTDDQVRPGHRISGAKVLWARPVPDYTWVCVAVETGEQADADPGFRWYRPDDRIWVDPDRTDPGEREQ